MQHSLVWINISITQVAKNMERRVHMPVCLYVRAIQTITSQHHHLNPNSDREANQKNPNNTKLKTNTTRIPFLNTLSALAR